MGQTQVSSPAPQTWQILDELRILPCYQLFVETVELLKRFQFAAFVAFDQTVFIERIDSNRYRLTNQIRTL